MTACRQGSFKKVIAPEEGRGNRLEEGRKTTTNKAACCYEVIPTASGFVKPKNKDATLFYRASRLFWFKKDRPGRGQCRGDQIKEGGKQQERREMPCERIYKIFLFLSSQDKTVRS
jgi:hypothetical protein